VSVPPPGPGPLHAPPEAPLALCLAGATASGKSALALAFAIARRCGGGPPVEIVACDSAQVYRGLDISSAKPTAAERALVPHHGLDLRDVTEPYSAAAFAADALRAIHDIRARGALPLVVGGTMLYFQALREGLDPMPPADPALRAAIEAEAALRGWPALHAELARLDPPTAARLAPHDAQRLARAIEVQRGSGRPLSAWQQRAGVPPAERARRFPLIALEPLSRAWLHARIEARFDAMLEAGLVAEVAALAARHAGTAGAGPTLPALRAVGVRQVLHALAEVDGDASRLAPGTPAFAAMRAAGIAATRGLAKRQGTWLRSLPERQVLPADAPDATAAGIRCLSALAAGEAGG
jgi:tRNA dimethylallyltransferase